LCSSGSRKIVEFTEPEERAERVGEGGSGREVLSELCVGEPKGSKEFRADAQLFVIEGEGGRRELSSGGDGDGTADEDEDGPLSSGTPTMAICGMWRSSEAIKPNST
jgi:hypothetical protein